MSRRRGRNEKAKQHNRRSSFGIIPHSDSCVLYTQVDCPRYSGTRREYKKQIKGEQILDKRSRGSSPLAVLRIREAEVQILLLYCG